jgi:phosphatidylethanolamine-binding protein (PEBP) family uncharacterized protein
MKIRRQAVVGLCAIILAGVTGCGNASHSSDAEPTEGTVAQSKSISSPQRQREKLPTISLSVTVDHGAREISHDYTCHGPNMSPPIEWGALPAKTIEADLFIVGVDLATKEPEPIYWAITGIPPSLHSLAAGAHPSGTVVGRNVSGTRKYSLCPRRHKELIAALLYALPTHLPAEQGFDPNSFIRKVIENANYEGREFFTYKRP